MARTRKKKRTTTTNKTARSIGVARLRRSYNKYKQNAAIEDPVTEPISLDPIPVPNNIEEISKDIITSIIADNTYSTIPYFFMPKPNISTQDHDVAKYNSGNCAFFANKVVERLQGHGIPAIQIPATLPPRLIQPAYPEYAHVSVLVPLESHFLLLEPAYFIVDPILVPRDGSSIDVRVKTFDAIWTFRYAETDHRIQVTEAGQPLFYYDLRRIVNPSESISHPVILRNQRLAIVKYDPFQDAKIAHLSVRLDTGALEGFHENDWLESLSFSTLHEAPTAAAKFARLCQWRGLSNEMCTAMGWSAPDLRKKVFAIIQQ